MDFQMHPLEEDLQEDPNDMDPTAMDEPYVFNDGAYTGGRKLTSSLSDFYFGLFGGIYNPSPPPPPLPPAPPPPNCPDFPAVEAVCDYYTSR